MKKIYPFFYAAVAGILLAACSNSPKEDATLKLSQTNFHAVNWDVNNTHMKVVSGKLLLGDKPVENVKIQIDKDVTKTTDKNGEFTININANEIIKESVKVINVNNAKINGKSVDEGVKKELLSLHDEITVDYPVKVDSVSVNKKDKNLVDVHGHAVLEKGQKYPNFRVDRYRVGGVVKDANGHPVKGATVNLRRDGVEGFSMSTPSDKNGVYTMYYMPDEDENHYFYVHYNNINYTLPEYRAYNFPADVGVNIDVTLPRTGTVIIDKPPTLVTTLAPGALYKGTLIGVNVDKNVKYTISIPDKDGNFILTLPKTEWDKNPSFYETVYNKFLLKDIKSGDVVNSNFIPAPKVKEPNQIKPSK